MLQPNEIRQKLYKLAKELDIIRLYIGSDKNKFMEFHKSFPHGIPIKIKEVGTFRVVKYRSPSDLYGYEAVSEYRPFHIIPQALAHTGIVFDRLSVSVLPLVNKWMKDDCGSEIYGQYLSIMPFDEKASCPNLIFEIEQGNMRMLMDNSLTSYYMSRVELLAKTLRYIAKRYARS